METQTASSTSTRKDVHGIINEKIIELLENGAVPWRTTWAEGGVPASLVSKRPFRGINTLLLATLGYGRNLFLTSKQLEGMNGSVKPNERQHMLVFYGNGQNSTEGSGEKKTSKLSYYSVYNVSQCVSIPGELVWPVMPSVNPVADCEKILAGIGQMPTIRNKEQDTFYDPLEDYINIPKLKSFSSPGSYYAALFHQLAHSTGHHTRLNRMGLVQMSEYGCDGHTLEELVAEIVTNYLENYAGIPCPFMPDEHYLNGWLRVFRADRYFVFNACNLAQRAIDFILNTAVDDRESKEE